MTGPSVRRRGAVVAALSACAVVLTTATATTATATDAASASADEGVLDGAQLYVDFDSSRVAAARGLEGAEQADALTLAAFPAATWLTQGSPEEVEQQARDVVTQAAAQGQVPTLVAYNVPFRDCAQYSAGGATSVAEYTAWIDAVAAGIGDLPAVVLLEPDGLGIIPHYTTVEGTLEWCQPAEADPATAADERFAMLNHAVDAFAALPAVDVYLDATHPGWLNVGDVSDRLRKAGVDRARGFFLNTSNYQWTANAVQYGRWIAQCLETEDLVACPNQYWNGGPEGTKIAELLAPWEGVGLSTLEEWSDDADDPALNTSGINARYADLVGDTVPRARFVVDTSRNGQGPWQAPEGVYSDAEEWCNPPGRGLGARPTTDTGDELVDAFLWIKIPGESDGRCLRGTAGPEDPERGIVDPPAGGWFPEQARELIELAVPPVEEPRCEVQHEVHGRWPGGFNTQVWIRNTGDTAIEGWQLQLLLADGQSVPDHWSADLTQSGRLVTAANRPWNATVAPGGRVTFGFIGSDPAAAEDPLLFLLDGAACTVAEDGGGPRS